MVNAMQNVSHAQAVAPWLLAIARLRVIVLKLALWKGVLGGLAILLCLSYVWQANGSAAVNVQIRSLRDQAAGLEVANQQLEQQVDKLKSLSRIAEASERLGLVSLPSQQYASAVSGQVVLSR